MLTKAAEESVKFCLQRFGLDILLPALSTFGDTNNISANIFDLVEDNIIAFFFRQRKKVMSVMFGLDYLSC